MEYNNGDRVIIHSFGDGFEHPGTVRGVAFEFAGNPDIYIVEMDKPDPWNSPWDCITVPNGCLRPEKNNLRKP